MKKGDTIMYYIKLKDEQYYSEDYYPRPSKYNVTLFDTIEDTYEFILANLLPEDCEVHQL